MYMNNPEIDLVQELTTFFRKRAEHVLFAYLFGSAAQGGQGALSDVDIALYIKVGTMDAFEAKLSLHADLCRLLKRNDVDVVVLNSASNLMLLDEIVRTGVVLFDGDPDARA